MNESIFRLRERDEIIGYLRIVNDSSYYSINGYQWSGKTIEYTDKDLFTGFKDRNDKRIFERDIVSSTDYPLNEYIIHHDALLNKFLLVSYENRDIFNLSLDEFFRHKPRVCRIGFLRN
jgi:hypothetical protein